MMPITKIVLAVPPLFNVSSYRFADWQNNKAARFHPLGAMYLGGYLRDAFPDIQIRIFDANVEIPLHFRLNPELRDNPQTDCDQVFAILLRKYLAAEDPQLIGISGLFHSLGKQFHFMTARAREACPAATIVVGGPYPSGSPHIVMRDSAVDYIIAGEGEVRFAALIHYLRRESGMETLDGVTMRGPDGDLQTPRIEGFSRSGALDLNTAPYPARDLLRQHEYTGVSSERSDSYLYCENYLTTAMYSSRGCPNLCTYCNSGAYNFYGPKFRWQTVEHTIKEVQHCIDEYGVDEVQFYDENLTASKKVTYELFSALNELDVNWTFVTLELEKLERKTLIAYTKKRSMSWFSIGVESGNDRVLKDVAGRRASRGVIQDKMSMVRGVLTEKCFVNASFIVGFPGETISEMFDTVDLAKTLEIDWAAFFCYMPLPGTPLYDLSVEQGYLDEDAVDFANIVQNQSIINTPDWSDTEVTFFRHWANYEVNFMGNKAKFEKAEKMINGYNYVLSVVPDHFFALYALGECYEHLGKLDQAREYYGRAEEQKDAEAYAPFVPFFDLPAIGCSKTSEIRDRFP